jgi:hypothetical protein
VREQDLFFIAGPIVDFALTVLRSDARRPLVVRATASAAGFAAVFWTQAIAYLRLNGRIGPSQLVVRKMYWTAPHALQVIGSPEHGFFWWTPFAVLAIVGLAALSVRNRRIAACLLLQVALQVYIGGSVDSWTVAGGFGQRRLVALTALFVIGYAALQTTLHRPAARRALSVAAVLAVYWNVALVAEFATHLMDRQRLAPAKNAYDAFVTLPREAPALAYRYLFDRASFYQRQPEAGR